MWGLTWPLSEPHAWVMRHHKIFSYCNNENWSCSVVGLFDLIAAPAPFTGWREECYSKAILLNAKLFSHKFLTKKEHLKRFLTEWLMKNRPLRQWKWHFQGFGAIPPCPWRNSARHLKQAGTELQCECKELGHLRASFCQSVNEYILFWKWVFLGCSSYWA